jgi:dsDNA-specific endonuclease/ATPase MutS2
MEKKDCFGSLKDIDLNNSQTTNQARLECRSCEEIRDCLRYSKQLAEEKKEKDELRKQNMISQIIDLSHITSNEIGSCFIYFYCLETT